jgi:hypothetical protein
MKKNKILGKAGVLLLAAVMVISFSPAVMANTTWLGYTDGYTETHLQWTNGAPFTMAIELNNPELGPYRGGMLCEVRFASGSDFDDELYVCDYEIYYATSSLPDITMLTPIATGTSSDTGWTTVDVPAQPIPATGSIFVIVRFPTYDYTYQFPGGLDESVLDLRGDYLLDESTGIWDHLSYWGFYGVWGLEAGICEAIPVPVDIKPGSCPNPIELKKKGVTPIAILGTQLFNVYDIDPSTIVLHREGYCGVVEPIRYNYEDVATPYPDFCEDCDDRYCCHELRGDGYIDLTLKFDTKEIVNRLLYDTVPGDVLCLKITGTTYDGISIYGQDVIWIR